VEGEVGVRFAAARLVARVLDRRVLDDVPLVALHTVADVHLPAEEKRLLHRVAACFHVPTDTTIRYEMLF